MEEYAVILSMSSQAWLFLSAVILGAIIGVFFDFFRILRKTVPFLARRLVWLTDFIFWIVVTAVMFYFLQEQNFGEIRAFALIGAVCGGALYFAILSRYVMLVFVQAIEFIKKAVVAVVRFALWPVRFIWGKLRAPLGGLYRKIRSGLLRARRYGKIRGRKTVRSLFILRKKV